MDIKIGFAAIVAAVLGVIAIKLWWPQNLSGWDALRWASHFLIASKLVIKLGAGVTVAAGWLWYKFMGRKAPAEGDVAGSKAQAPGEP